MDYTPPTPKSKIPFGYCKCGCGGLAPPSPRNSYEIGLAKGQPLPFISGHQFNKTLAQRFWEKVIVVDDENSCWLWVGGKTIEGYGRMKGGDGRRNELSHRVSWTLHYGEIPEGMLVLHRCDRPSCIRPHHLWLGTDQDNMSDRDRKGRQAQPRGEKSGKAKLTDPQIIAIRQRRKEGWTYKMIADEFNMHETNASNICNKRTWGHVPDPPDEPLQLSMSFLEEV